MKINRSRGLTPVKIALIVIAAVLLLGGAYAVAAQVRGWWPFMTSQNHNESPTASDESDGSDLNNVNYGPPSDQDVEESQEGKKNTDGTGGATTTDTGSSKTYEVAISEAGKDGNGNMEVRAFTPSVVEGIGTCTATLTQGSNTVKKSSKAFIDASSSICKPISIAMSQFKTKGTWNLVVTYESSTGKGTSERIEVQL